MDQTLYALFDASAHSPCSIGGPEHWWVSIVGVVPRRDQSANMLILNYQRDQKIDSRHDGHGLLRLKYPIPAEIPIPPLYATPALWIYFTSL